MACETLGYLRFPDDLETAPLSEERNCCAALVALKFVVRGLRSVAANEGTCLRFLLLREYDAIFKRQRITPSILRASKSGGRGIDVFVAAEQSTRHLEPCFRCIALKRKRMRKPFCVLAVFMEVYSGAAWLLWIERLPNALFELLESFVFLFFRRGWRVSRRRHMEAIPWTTRFQEFFATCLKDLWLLVLAWNCVMESFH